MPGVIRRAGRRIAGAALGLTLLAAAATGGPAQGLPDRPGAAIGPDDAQAVLALIERDLRSTDARLAGLRRGRAGGICGTVEVRNRMGTYTGPRPFVADLGAGFAGRLPEGAELRNPGSAADFTRLERARAMFVENCIDR
ncbi:hypothetical protein [Methylobacterium sp. WL2]|uniref:hypothetical protein n=1 Tax=Methylobacterium sp. WL2 TaxID=2603902 RepID=UPI0011C9A3E5|nr:hypothetical protein [Methylobacterium sp. WL2]TXN55096.1 hypothetical protein FV241_21160 [Methylobacterium sp. WL2]